MPLFFIVSVGQVSEIVIPSIPKGREESHVGERKVN